jgi:ankyrin repeat protein
MNSIYKSEALLQTVKLLVNNGASVDVRNQKDAPLVLEASKKGYVDVTKLLIESGARLNDTGFERAAVVHFAAKQYN